MSNGSSTMMMMMMGVSVCLSLCSSSLVPVVLYFASTKFKNFVNNLFGLGPAAKVSIYDCKLVKDSTPKGPVRIDWGFTEGDATWACNAWKPDCGNNGGCNAFASRQNPANPKHFTCRIGAADQSYVTINPLGSVNANRTAALKVCNDTPACKPPAQCEAVPWVEVP